MYWAFDSKAKAFECVDQNKLWKILKEMGIPDLRNLPASWEICMQVKKLEQLELDMEQQTGPKLGNEYAKAIYCRLACLTYRQNTSCEMPG